jgi:uncharacterized protein
MHTTYDLRYRSLAATLGRNALSRRFVGLSAVLLTAALTACSTPRPFDPLAEDPPVTDRAFPAESAELTITSHDARMSGRFFVAQGPGPHTTVVIARGMPDLLGSLDIAMALRRAGFNVLSFNYRGCWGSEGTFSLMHSLEDVQSAVAFLRDAANAGRLRVDPERIALLGYSYGGPVILQAAAQDPRILAAAMLDGSDMRSDVQELRDTPGPAVAWMDSLLPVRLASGGRALADEIVSQQAFWHPAHAAQGLAGKRVLLVVATRGTGAEPPVSPSLQEIFGARSKLTAVTLDTDHGFSDQRIALTRTVLAWMEALP